MDAGKYGRMKLKEDEVLIREGVLRFPSSPEERPSLIGGRCLSCGDVSFRRRHYCPKCGSETEEFFFGCFAEVVTYSVVHQGGMGIKTPYIAAMVNFPEINDPELAIICRIVDCPIEDIKIGMKVELIIDKVRSTLRKDIFIVSYLNYRRSSMYFISSNFGLAGRSRTGGWAIV